MSAATVRATEAAVPGISERLPRFLAIGAQLALLLAVFRLYRVEEPAFFVLAVVMFAGFAVSYWLPVAWKEPFFAALSVAGAFFVTEPVVVAAVVGTALIFFAISRAKLSYRARVFAIGAVFLGLLAARNVPLPGAPPALWPTIGAVFMFRLLIYVYDLRNMKQPPTLSDFGTYFLMLPNYYFLFFPVIDYQTMRKSFLRRDQAEVAQRGVWWIVRGTAQLLIYRAILVVKPAASPDVVTTLPLLVENLILTYMLYLRVSGTFHIIVGMLHLFGYDLPETHRRYLFASSFTDFWRRINIYWKDFMAKVVYFPVFFRFRKSGQGRAQIIATSAVFFATWALHGYQYYWLSGRWLFTVTDSMFWGLLAVLLLVNLAIEIRARARGALGRRGPLRTAVQVAGMFAVMTVLWSLWSSPSLNAWLDLLTYWRVG